MNLDLAYSLADQNLERGKSVGILNVSLNLLRRLARRPEIERLTVLGNTTFDPAVAHGPQVAWRAHDEVLRSPLHRIAWDQWRVYAAARAAGSGWLLLPKGFASFLRRPPLRIACVIHDGMHEYYREHYPHGFSRFEMLYFPCSFRAALRHAGVLFTNSEFTAAEVRRIAGRYRIAPPPVITMGIGFSDEDLLMAQLRESAPRADEIVVLASRWPHKRTVWTIEAMQAWQERTRYRGSVSWVGSLPDGVRLPARDNWTMHARLSFAEYGRLLGRARALVYTSEYEGFGMPPIEALAAGAVPAYSDIPATREVMAGAGCPFVNGDLDSFGAALDRALATPPDTAKTWLRELLGRHTWEKVCDRVIQGLTQAEAGRR